MAVRSYDYDIVFFDNIYGINGTASAPFLRWGDDRLDGEPVLMEKVLGIRDFQQLYQGYVQEPLDDENGHASLRASIERMRGAAGHR